MLLAVLTVDVFVVKRVNEFALVGANVVGKVDETVDRTVEEMVVALFDGMVVATLDGTVVDVHPVQVAGELDGGGKENLVDDVAGVDDVDGVEKVKFENNGRLSFDALTGPRSSSSEDSMTLSVFESVTFVLFFFKKNKKNRGYLFFFLILVFHCGILLTLGSL